MLRRKIETQLEAWRSAPKRTALLVTGARQIGKTYIISTLPNSITTISPSSISSRTLTSLHYSIGPAMPKTY